MSYWFVRLRCLCVAVVLVLASMIIAAKDIKSDLSDIHVIFFETSIIDEIEMLPVQQAKRAGLSVTVAGTGIEYKGFGQKWTVVSDILAAIPSTSLVLIADTRDVLLNIHRDSDERQIAKLVGATKNAFLSLTKGNKDAVVFGTEFQCCVFALTHIPLGGYFDSTGTQRTTRACMSGKPGCEWMGTPEVSLWANFMQALAFERTGVDVDDAFLNGGLVAGTPESLMNIIRIADLHDSEDDQAVFTDLMFHRPDMIYLDYGQQIFGSARFVLSISDGGCVFEATNEGNIRHKEIQTIPFLLHTPNHYFQCLDWLTEQLGENRTEAFRELAGPGRLPNYEKEEIEMVKRKRHKDRNRRLQRRVMIVSLLLLLVAGYRNRKQIMRSIKSFGERRKRVQLGWTNWKLPQTAMRRRSTAQRI